MVQEAAAREPAPRDRPGRRYLDVAVDLARRPPGGVDGGDQFAALVRVADLAARVGVGRTSIYKAWPSRRDLWRDLARYVTYHRDFSRPDSALPWAPPPTSFEPIDLATPEWAEVLRGQCNGTVEASAADPTWIVRAAMLAYPEQAASARSRRTVESYRLGTFARRIAIGLGRGRRGFPGPFGLRHLTEASWAVLDGVLATSHWNPPLRADTVVFDDGLGPRPWVLAGWPYRAVMYEVTKVAEGPGAVVGPFDAGVLDPNGLDPPEWTEGRRAVLATGIQALVEGLSSEHRDAALGVLPHITIDRVARTSGVSRRAVYDAFPTRDHLLLGLLDELLAQEHDELVAAVESIWPAGATPALDPAELARLLPAPTEGVALELAVSAYLPEGRRPEVHRILLAHHRRAVGLLASRLGRLDPALEVVTPEQVAEIVLALRAGLQRIRRVHGPQGWSGDLGVTCGWAVWALCHHRPSATR